VNWPAIDAHHALPGFPGEAFERLAPAHPRVVDENVQLAGAPTNLVRERRHPLLARDRAAKTLAMSDRRKLRRSLLADFNFARGDQHPRARAQQRLRANPPEPARAASDERSAASDGKEIGQGEHGRFSLPEKSSAGRS